MPSAAYPRARPAVEEWRAIPGYEGLYEVSDRGRVRGLDRLVRHSRGGLQILAGRVMRLTLNGPYLRVSLCKEGTVRPHNVHRLVLEIFRGPCPDGAEGRHLDGDPINNRLENLSWGTHTENIRDSIRHGTRPRGEVVASSKLTEDDVRLIRARLEEGVPQRKIAEEFGVAQTLISRIARRGIWGHVA